MPVTHTLLKRQLRKIFGEGYEIPEPMRPLIDAVDEAYQSFDADRLLLERSLDLTSREMSEQKESLRRLADEWQTTFDSDNDLILVISHDQRVIRINRATCAFLEKPAEEIIGKHCWELFHGTKAPPDFCPYRRVLESKQRESAELHLKEKNIWISVVVDPILDEQDDVVGAVQISRDVTERKRTEQDLEAKMKQLAKLNEIMLTREIRVVEMKEEVNTLLKELGRKPKYAG